MKQFLKILKSIPCVLARIAHVIEHIFCDEVPHISYEHNEDDYEEESGSFSDHDPYLESDLAALPDYDEDLYLSESRSSSDLDSGPADFPDDMEDDL